ncbi:MAG TPA: DUF5666 domain-containing protein [Ktedonobacteraceae bacterium]|nr:DUF5666 domain-containing protein [Ktedonobacteraceae bacterium]
MQKKSVLIMLSVLAILLIGVISLAIAFALANPSHASTVNGTPTATLTTAQGSTTKKTRQFIGVIQSLSAQGFVIVVNGKKMTTVTVDNSTKYSSAEGPIAFSNLIVGETVKVRGTYDNSTQTVTAIRVTVVTPTKKGSGTPPVGNLTPTP